jgi:hypothetical protein
MTARLDGLGNCEGVMTSPAGCRNSAGWTCLGIEPEPAVRAVNMDVVDFGGKNAATPGAANAHLQLAFGIGIPRENIGREQVHTIGANRAQHRLDPKVVQHIADLGFAVRRSIKSANPLPHSRGEPAKSLLERVPVQPAESDAHRLASDRIDVAAQSRETQLVCLANGRAAAHKRVEYGEIREVVLPVKGIC